MPDKMKAPIYELCEQTFQQWERSLKAGLKFQEDAARACMEPLAPMPGSAEARKRMLALVSEGTELTQRNVEEGIRLMEQASQANLDTFRQLLQTMPGEPVEGMQARVKSMWEVYMAALKSNVQTLSQAHAKLLETFLQALPKEAAGFGTKAKAA